jgi:S1-C subfamily serine protease
MHKHIVVLLACVLLAACSSNLLPFDTLQQISSVTRTPTGPAPIPRPTATPTLMPVAIATRIHDAEPLRPSAIFQKISPSVAFISTDAGKGSGVLLEDGFLLTNAHVIWPAETVRVVFPDGLEIEDAPVFNWDLMADLALIGPLEVDSPHVSLINGEDLIIGSDVYLIGYPGEVDNFPQPTISRGLISRLREWKPLNLTYFQSDAKIAGGQSGGVLVSEAGEVIGISGFSFANNEFALVASAADLAPLVERLKRDTERSMLISSRLSTEKASQRHEYEFDREPLDQLLVFELSEDETVTSSDPAEEKEKEIRFDLSFSGGGSVSVRVQSASGIRSGFASLQGTKDDKITFTPKEKGTYFVIVQRPENFDRDQDIGRLSIESTVTLTPYREIEEGLETLVIGDYVSGFLDYQGDRDLYKVYLKAGDVIYLKVESILLDPYVSVSIPQLDMQDGSIPGDDDTGKGLFGYDAEMSYKAPQDGAYYIVVSGGYGRPGGYFLTLDQPAEGAPTPMAPQPTATPFVGAFGDVQQYTSKGKVAFQIQIPADWSTTIRATGFAASCRMATTCYANPRNSIVIAIAEEDLDAVGLTDFNLEEYAELFIEAITKQTAGSKLIFNEIGVSAQGYEVAEFELSIQNNLLNVRRMVLIKDGIAFNVSFLYAGRGGSDLYPNMTDEERADLDELVRNVFDSLTIEE